MNACTLVDLDTSTLPGGYSFERFRDNLAVRIKAVPELRAKLADSALNFDTPVWVEDRDFDLDRHVHVAKLSSHGDQYELSEVVGRLAATPLDRRMPLWDMWVIEGSSGEGPPHKVTLLFRVHHVLMDGVTGRDLWSRCAALLQTRRRPNPLMVSGASQNGESPSMALCALRFDRGYCSPECYPTP